MSPSYHSRVKSLCDEEFFYAPRRLSAEHVSNCKLVSNRRDMLRNLPRGGIVAEVGTAAGDFARDISSIVLPDQLHIFDRNLDSFDFDAFRELIDNEIVFTHLGDSSTLLSKFGNEFFDWVYIDGDHSFEGVTKDIAQAIMKIKPEGYIIFNDYTVYSPLEKIQYGVMRAVNHLCLEHDFEIFMFALNILGYHDVALRRRLAH